MVNLTPEESLLSQIAARAGKGPEQLVQDALTPVLEDEAQFTQAVLKGFSSLDAGRFVEHEEIGAPIERRSS
jgi:predicted transcriptional regulator